MERRRRSSSDRGPCSALRREGQSLVELAIVSPIVLLLMLGTLDFGRAFFDFIQLRNGTNAGALSGARNPFDDGLIASEVTNSTVPPSTVVTVGRSGQCGVFGESGSVTVQATSVFEPMSGNFFGYVGMPTSFTLRSSTTMRCLT